MNNSSSIEGGHFWSFSTRTYKLHYFQSLSNVRLVLVSDPNTLSKFVRQLLIQIYGQVYVEYVAKNPLHSNISMIDNDAFNNELNKLLVQNIQ